MHLNSILMFEKYALGHFPAGARVLEIGPDGHPSTYRRLVQAAPACWDTLDIASDPRLSHVARGEYDFPIEDGCYDIVVSAQVIEHVRKAWLWMREVARVCRPGGLVVTVNPVSWPYHAYPVDCWRIFPDGMRALYEDAGLEVLSSRFECLELPAHFKRIPGRSIASQSKGRRFAAKAFGPLGIRVECAFDTLTVGRKA